MSAGAARACACEVTVLHNEARRRERWSNELPGKPSVCLACSGNGETCGAHAVLFWNYFVELKVCRHTSGYLPRPRPRPPRPRPPRPRPATGASDAMRRLNAAERFESPPRAAFFAALRASRAISCSARARSSAESEDRSSLKRARSSALRCVVASSACAPQAVVFLACFGGASPTGAAARLAARRASAAAERGARAEDGAGAGAFAGAGAGTGAATAPARRAARRAIAAGERFSAFWRANCSWRVIPGAADAAGAAGAASAAGAGAGARAARFAARRASAAAERLRSIFAVLPRRGSWR